MRMPVRQRMRKPCVMLSRSVVDLVRKACVLLRACLANGHARNVFRDGTAVCVSDPLTVSQTVRVTGALMSGSLRFARVLSFPCPMCIRCVLLVDVRA
ncbi:hypothetical protein HDG32_002953 [Paraburkholderia sp. CI2]|nr:hypothetical protein [Paraburkholderia sp. CI2]